MHHIDFLTSDLMTMNYQPGKSSFREQKAQSRRSFWSLSSGCWRAERCSRWCKTSLSVAYLQGGGGGKTGKMRDTKQFRSPTACCVCRPTFVTAKVEEDGIVEGAPSPLPLGAKEAVICRGMREWVALGWESRSSHGQKKKLKMEKSSQ